MTELHYEYQARFESGMRRHARNWYRRQAIGVCWRALRDRMRGNSWGTMMKPMRRPTRLLDTITRDLRFAIRSIRQRPLYAGTIIATLALAIGANTAVFSVINAVLLQPLPYPSSQELVTVGRESRIGSISYPDYRDWQKDVTTLSSFAAYTLARETYVGDGFAEEWTGVETTPNLFAVLAAYPHLGRTLQEGIDVPGTDALVISHRLWQRRFAGDSSVLGRQIRFEDVTRTLVGVMPPGFHFPTATEDYWAPLSSSPFFGETGYLENRNISFLRTVGRLARGRTVPETQGEIQGIAHAIDRSAEGAADAKDSTRIYASQYRESVVGDTRPLFALLAGAVILVLTTACANIANLTLTQATIRRQEFAVRMALGAGVRRVAAQTLTEHLVLAVIGGGLGLLLAHLAVDLLLTLGPADLPRRSEIGIDGTTFGFTATVAILCGLIFGTVPVWPLTRAHLNERLRDGGRVGIARGGARVLSGLAVAQIALAVVLTVGAGLLLNSFVRLSSIKPGFDLDHTLTLKLQLPRSRYADPVAVGQYYRDVRDRVTQISGVRDLAYTSALPLSGSGMTASYYLDGDDADTEREPVSAEVVDGNYFAALGIPLLAGRAFDDSELRDSPMKVVINRTMAEQHWPGQSALGKRFTLDDDFADDQWATIIGVTDDVHKASLADRTGPMAYFHRQQFAKLYSFISGRNGYLVVRTSGDPARRVAPILDALRSVDPHIPFMDIRTTAELVGASVAEPRFRTILIVVFATLAVVVALIGIYGVLAFSVAQRGHEIGVRMALGADPTRVVAHVLRDGARLLVVGLPVGALGALAAGRVVQSMLFDITAADPVTLVLATVGFGVAAMVACYVPARRAGRVDPLVTLRRE